MNWSNVKLIFFREVRDQLRDRRTLFMIAVLPIVLYPLLGLSFFQIAQFLREQPSRVLVTGLPQIVDVPPLVEDDRFAAQWLSDPRQAQLYNLQFAPATDPSSPQDTAETAASAREAVQRGEFEAVIVFP